MWGGQKSDLSNVPLVVFQIQVYSQSVRPEVSLFVWNILFFQMLCVWTAKALRAVPEKKNMGVFDDTFILPPPPMRFNYCLGPPSIRSDQAW